MITLARRSPDWLVQLKATRDAYSEGLDTLDLRHADEVLARASHSFALPFAGLREGELSPSFGD